MLDDLKNAIENTKKLQSQSSDLANKINDLATELNNIKTIVSPVSVSAGGAASQVTSVMGGMLMCSFGIAPSSYLSIRATTLTSSLPSSNISDSKIGVNILPFGACTNPANPAKIPFVFPWPCIPTLTPFIPTSPTTMLEKMPITTMNSKAMCTFAAGGMVNFISPGQFNAKAT
ncbi:type VI secretion system PAAR-like protein IglG [Francisella adeliensis]|uniref:DUF4280 domain-containing protein n=1 Tax=Francisella adeliensis TaxID=2007306 RepID=A0A2Z4XWA2_9GAMM|nr:type VI secretion system PAAR-like protein IglG [Francisella adeliensis]AXA32996.1 hypothetical protein CDH04_00560 [Francisella adeliensis]MBK2086119.1 DUF4280 domain-containing protein [Francisella adeliensis]MBK2096717.1 DUF4280 domain-containing protein [Francisella adeliensis]QIW11222.1 DUF4280 domain-containing protein [Francisella adeliensis]QIW13098.1 DUF4280 domain-containing protein [Francisella adeliensis]